jgi:rod shape determining protein RodA
LWGSGIGYGAQSKLEFLPEYQTDFIFAAFAEEWGLFGVFLLFLLFAIFFYRLIVHARLGATNFETLFTIGVFFWFGAQFSLHTGMNMGLLPITGATMPFLSFGGSHLVAEYIALGIVLHMARHRKIIAHSEAERELEGLPAPLS